MTDLLNAELMRLAGRCTVEIQALGVAGGSGFFVAPGVVVSCAHVAGLEGVAARTVMVMWEGVIFTGNVRAVPSKHGTSDRWQYPDLCVIELDRRPQDQPSVVLGGFQGIANSKVYLAGFNK